MSKALELVQLAKEGNASRFGDAFVAGVQERVSGVVAERRSTMFAGAVAEGANPFAKKDDDDSDKDADDDKGEKKDKDDDKDGGKEKDDDDKKDA